MLLYPSHVLPDVDPSLPSHPTPLPTDNQSTPLHPLPTQASHLHSYTLPICISHCFTSSRPLLLIYNGPRSVRRLRSAQTEVIGGCRYPAQAG